MSAERQLLKELLNNASIKTTKRKEMVQILQRSLPIDRIKDVSNNILCGNIDEINDKTVEDLINLFIKNKEDKEVDIKKQLELEKLKYKALEEKFKKVEKELEFERRTSNEKLTNNTKVTEVEDDDINKLYYLYLNSGEKRYKGAFIVGDIIPKTYYKINRQRSDKNAD